MAPWRTVVSQVERWLQRNLRAHGRSVARGALEVQGAADGGQAIAQAGDAAAGGVSRAPDAVVLDHQDEPATDLGRFDRGEGLDGGGESVVRQDAVCEVAEILITQPSRTRGPGHDRIW